MTVRWSLVPGTTLDDKVAFLEQHDLEYIDLHGPALEVPGEALIDFFRHRRVKVGTVDALNNLLADDEQIRAQRMARNHEIIDLAAAIGAFGVLVHPMFAVPPVKDLVNYVGLTPAGTAGNPFKGYPAEAEAVLQQKPVLLRQISEMASHAARVGVVLLLEPVNRYEGFYFNRLENAVEICEAVGNPLVKVLPDFFHNVIEEKDVPSAIMAAGRHVGFVHVSDTNRWRPGLGFLDFHAVFGALKAVGYDGYLSVACEPFGDPGRALFEAAASIRKLWNEA